MPDFQQFTSELKSLVNKHGLDNQSNTADFILADMLTENYKAYERTVRKRGFTAPPTPVQPR